MIKRVIASRYSKVLFNLDSQKKSNLEKRLLDFESILILLKKNPNLVRFLKSPQISLPEKKEIFRSLLENGIDMTFFNFFFYLIEQRNLDDLAQIALEYRRIVNEFLGIWEAKIITAVPIEPAVQEKLKEKLEKFFQKKMKINKEIDPKIIGGALLIVANEMINWSVTGRLRKMRESLLV